MTERAQAERYIAMRYRFVARTPDLHEVSANSSFLRLILSFKPSASRRAVAILFCMASLDISDDILHLHDPLVQLGDGRINTNRSAMEIEMGVRRRATAEEVWSDVV